MLNYDLSPQIPSINNSNGQGIKVAVLGILFLVLLKQIRVFIE